VAAQLRRRARIEAAFDQVDACERLLDFAGALEWLDRVEALSGGLPPAYRALQARCERAWFEIRYGE
jgi:hypothetical protein